MQQQNIAKACEVLLAYLSHKNVILLFPLVYYLCPIMFLIGRTFPISPRTIQTHSLK